VDVGGVLGAPLTRGALEAGYEVIRACSRRPSLPRSRAACSVTGRDSLRQPGGGRPGGHGGLPGGGRAPRGRRWPRGWRRSTARRLVGRLSRHRADRGAGPAGGGGWRHPGAQCRTTRRWATRNRLVAAGGGLALPRRPRSGLAKHSIARSQKSSLWRERAGARGKGGGGSPAGTHGRRVFASPGRAAVQGPGRAKLEPVRPAGGAHDFEAAAARFPPPPARP
jgi:hypothetical protein